MSPPPDFSPGAACGGVVGNVNHKTALAGSGGRAPYSADPANFCTADGQSDCSRLINHDGAHKTSAVHAILADKFIKQFGLSAE